MMLCTWINICTYIRLHGYPYNSPGTYMYRYVRTYVRTRFSYIERIHTIHIDIGLSLQNQPHSVRTTHPSIYPYTDISFLLTFFLIPKCLPLLLSPASFEPTISNHPHLGIDYAAVEFSLPVFSCLIYLLRRL